MRLNVVDALSIDNRTTALNLYMTGMIDWVTVPPAEVLREFMKQAPKRNDFNPAPQLTTYYFLLNNTRPPLDDKRVRQALSLATDREEITRVATGAGEVPALSLVPPSMPHYKIQPCAAIQSRGRAETACRGRLSGRKRISQTRDPVQHRPAASGDCRTAAKAMAEQAGNHRLAAQRRVGFVSGFAATAQVSCCPAGVGRRLCRSEHISRHVRHGRRKQLHWIRAIRSTTS